jgi:CMP-N-acetylneuraminic acid synthetase
VALQRQLRNSRTGNSGASKFFIQEFQMQLTKTEKTKLAVIPARGGSTRLIDKNIYPLGGKPLICYTIESVIAADCFDTVMVSTDSEKIVAIASNYNIQIHKREAKYATHSVTVLEAMLALMQEIPKHDIFSYFLPTCPFRNPEDIIQGMALLTEDTDSVVSITGYSDPIQLAMIEKDSFVFPVFDNLKAGFTNSKFFNKFYRPNGAFYISWWNKLKQNRNFFVSSVKGYKMPKLRSIDINTIDDIRVAEGILNMILSNRETQANELRSHEG